MSAIGFRIRVAFCALLMSSFHIQTTEAARNIQAWKLSYRLYSAAGEDEAKYITFTESADFSRIDRSTISFIIDYRQNIVHRLDHNKQRVCSSTPGKSRGIDQKLRALLGSYKTIRTNIQQVVNGRQAEKVYLHFGSSMASLRTMAPVSMTYLGETFREQVVTNWIFKDFPDKTTLFSILKSHSDFYRENPLLLQLDTPALFTILDGIIVQQDYTANKKQYLMELQNSEPVSITPDTFSIPARFTACP